MFWAPRAVCADGRVSFDRVKTELMIVFALPSAQPRLLGSLGSVKNGMSLRTLFQTAADISDRPSPSISRKILSADSGSSIGAKVDWNAPIYPITKA